MRRSRGRGAVRNPGSSAVGVGRAGARIPAGVAATPFSDGFESGSFSAWTLASTAGAGTALVTALAAHDGTFGAHLTNTTLAGSLANVRKTLAQPVIDLTATGWFRWNADSNTAGSNGTGFRFFNAAGERTVDIFRQDTVNPGSGGIAIRSLREAGTNQFGPTITTVALNTWIKISFRAIQLGPGAVSRCIVLINDVQMHDSSVYDIKAGAWDRVQIGTEHTQVLDLHVDSVVLGSP